MLTLLERPTRTRTATTITKREANPRLCEEAGFV